VGFESDCTVPGKFALGENIAGSRWAEIVEYALRGKEMRLGS
jgi:hypothetical protein